MVVEGAMQMRGEFGKVADHFGKAIWRRGEIGCKAKRSSGSEPLKVGTILRNRYKLERFLFWDGRYNHYVATTIGGEEIYELREYPDHHGIEGEMAIMEKGICHRGIIRRYDLFIEDNRSYLVLEYQEAPDLENSRRIFSAHDILWIAFNLADTLDCLHRHGIAQVDLSSTNIKDMGEVQKIVDLSGCYIFGAPSLEGFREARSRDFLGLIDLLERLILKATEESEDPSLLHLIRGLEEMVDKPPLSAGDFTGRLSQFSTIEAKKEDERGMSEAIPRDEKIRAGLRPCVL